VLQGKGFFRPFDAGKVAASAAAAAAAAAAASSFAQPPTSFIHSAFHKIPNFHCILFLKQIYIYTYIYIYI
jgi:hypothetical protein